MCNHDWQPIPGWYARYRCSICRVIGGKFGVICARHGVRNLEIQPYRCAARIRGVRCESPAVHSWYGKNFRCAEHRRRERSAGARHELAQVGAEEAAPRSTARVSSHAPVPERA